MLFDIGDLSGNVYPCFVHFGNKTGLEADPEYCISHSILNDEGKPPIYKECHCSIVAETIEEARKIAQETSKETRKEYCESTCEYNFKCQAWHELYGEKN